MLIQSHNKGIFEKVIAARNGQLVRVRFAIVEIEGILRGQVLSVTPIVSVEGEVASANLYLPASVETDVFEAVESSFNSVFVSPFTTLEFFMSQPTRAPAF